MTLKANVKAIFSKPPCFFEWGADDTEAISQGSAVLQCKTDYDVSLMVMMPPNNDRIVQYNVTLLVLLIATAGWNDGEQWIAQCFREAKQHTKGGIFDIEHDSLSCRLVIDRGHGLTTLTIKESV